MRTGLAAFILVLSVLPLSAQLPSCAIVRAGGLMSEADSIRGPWELTGQDSFFELVRTDGSGDYELVMLDGPATSVAPGTAVGRLIPLADKYKYDVELTVLDSKGTRNRRRTFILTFSRDYSSFSLQLYNRYRSISVDRLFPYLFRIGFSKSDPRPNNIDGARNLSIRNESELVL